MDVTIISIIALSTYNFQATAKVLLEMVHPKYKLSLNVFFSSLNHFKLLHMIFSVKTFITIFATMWLISTKDKEGSLAV